MVCIKKQEKIARLKNSSRLIIEGDNYLIGEMDCDETSTVLYSSRNIQTRQNIFNNSIAFNDVVVAHYKVFKSNHNFWYETVNNKVVKPLELANNYQTHQYNGRLYTSGKCRIPMGDIDIKGKTIAIRIISPNAFSATQRSYPFTINAGSKGNSITFSQGKSVSLKKTSILYASEVNLGAIEKGERYVFLPSKQEKYILNNFETVGNATFMISDIYITDKDINEIAGNEKLRIIDIMNSLDSNLKEDGFISGYNKGTSNDRPKDLTSEDEGFEFFDTTLHKPIYWTGDRSIGDNGWVDALGKHPSR